MDYSEIINRHKKIALQFSGGKDSLALLYLLQPYWDRLTVYWLNSGNPFPETVELVEKIKRQVPHFAEIEGRQPQTLKQLGWPSDIVPVSASPLGHLIEGKSLRLNDRYFCCWKSIMEPMQQRMLQDGITLIIRGQKNADRAKGPLTSGNSVAGIEVLYPLETWTDADVMRFLTDKKVEVPRFYHEGLTSAPDCMNCTAWLEHGMPGYVKKHHPESYPDLKKRLNTIADLVEPHVRLLNETRMG